MNIFSHHRPPKNLINTLIGLATTINGDVKFTGGLRVEGSIYGDITSNEYSIVTIVENAVVNGSITASHVIINGSVTGPISCDILELQENAHVVGNISYKALSIKEGALIAGIMTPHTVENHGTSQV